MSTTYDDIKLQVKKLSCTRYFFICERKVNECKKVIEIVFIDFSRRNKQHIQKYLKEIVDTAVQVNQIDR